MNKKPRADSALKTLPAPRQDAVAEYAVAHTLGETVKWLAADGLKTSSASLSEFLSWHALRQQFRQDEQTTEALLEQLKAEIPNLTEEQLDDLGQRTFSLLAIRRQDLEGFVTVRAARTNAELERAKLKLRERAEARQTEKLKLDVERFQFDAAKACLKALPSLKAIASNKSLSEAEKTQSFMEKLFGKKPS